MYGSTQPFYMQPMVAHRHAFALQTINMHSPTVPFPPNNPADLLSVCFHAFSRFVCCHIFGSRQQLPKIACEARYSVARLP